MKVKASVNGAISLVNAIATWKGATLGIVAKVEAIVSTSEGKGIHLESDNQNTSSRLVKKVVELSVPKMSIDYMEDKFIVADRWSPSDAPDVDTRRKSNHLKESGLFDGDKYYYLDYRNDLVYNCSLIKYNPNPLYTTFTGTGILADLMNKEVFILYDDDLIEWDGKPISSAYRLHYIKNRKSKLRYLKEFNYD